MRLAAPSIHQHPHPTLALLQTRLPERVAVCLLCSLAHAQHSEVFWDWNGVAGGGSGNTCRLMRHLLCRRHHFKCFTCIHSFNPHSSRNYPCFLAWLGMGVASQFTGPTSQPPLGKRGQSSTKDPLECLMWTGSHFGKPLWLV